jgi:hypothetical protein
VLAALLLVGTALRLWVIGMLAQTVWGGTAPRDVVAAMCYAATAALLGVAVLTTRWFANGRPRPAIIATALGVAAGSIVVWI